MTIRCHCDHCSAEFQVHNKYSGKKLRCPECQTPTQVPLKRNAASSGTIPLAKSDPPTKKKRRPAPSSAEQPVLSRNHSSSSNSNDQLFMGIAIGGGVAGVAVVILLAIVFGISDLLQSSNETTPVVTQQERPRVAPQLSVAPAPTGNRRINDENTPASDEPVELTEQPVPNETSTTPTVPPTTTSSPSAPAEQPKTTVNTQKPSVTKQDRPNEKLDSVELIARVKPAVVRIHVVTDRGVAEGSGFVVDRNGTVVTNYHVMQGAKRATASFANDFETVVSGFYRVLPKYDIAVIKLAKLPENVEPIPMSAKLPAEGTEVFAFGAPQGLPFTTSEGIISAHRTKEDMRKQLGIDVEGAWLQTTSPISPGSSGGPLVDRYGQVVAMNTLTMVVGQNLNFAMSSSDIIAAVENAPSSVQALEPEVLSPYQKSVTRKGARDEIGTRRGDRLMAKTKEVWLISAKEAYDSDPTGRVWEWVTKKAEYAVNGSDLELSFGKPSPDAAVLIVMMDLKPIRSKLPGTQEVKIKAELICYDSKGGKFDKYCRVWKHEKTVGTISQQSLLQGRIPRRADDNLRSFFRSFRIAFSKAKNKTSKLP